MFTRARLHLTLLYAGLLGLTVLAVAGAIGLLSVQEARSTDDRELKIRATAIAAALPPGPPVSYSPQQPPRGPDDHGPRGPGPRPEELGLLEYVIPVSGGQLVTSGVQ